MWTRLGWEWARLYVYICVWIRKLISYGLLWIHMAPSGTMHLNVSQHIESATHWVLKTRKNSRLQVVAAWPVSSAVNRCFGEWSKHKQTTGTYRNHTSFSCVIYSDLRYIEVHSLWLEFVLQAWCRLYSALNVASSPLAPQNIQLSHRSGCSGCLRETATIQWLLSFVGMWHVVQCGTMRLNVLNLLIHVLISWATA